MSEKKSKPGSNYPCRIAFFSIRFPERAAWQILPSRAKDIPGRGPMKK